MYCNVFFRRLAVHMLSSETCMRASQESLSNKRVHQDSNATISFDEKCIALNTRASKRTAYICDGISYTTHREPNMIQTKEQSDINPSEKSKLLEDDDDVCINTFNDSDGEMINIEPSSSNKLIVDDSAAIKVLPLDGDYFNRAFTPEEHFMINLCHVCDRANAPLNLVDKIVTVIRDAQSNGLDMNSNIIQSREYFLKHLNKRFVVPEPESVNIAIEDISGNEQIIQVIRQIFLLQAMDLIHDHELWGNENNFIGTVGMDDPFNSFKHGRSDNKVDEIVDGVWYKKQFMNVHKLPMESVSWYWVWSAIVIKQVLTFTRETLWSLFCLLFACLIENAGIRLLHGAHLDTFLILTICLLQIIVFHRVDI